VENVRPHLRKVFENLMDVTFKPDKTITSMFSGEKEEIQFVSAVDPKDKGVEYWMGELEEMMFTSIKHSLKFSVDDYLVLPRTDWSLKHPGQCVLNGSQVHWTKEVEQAIKENSLGKYLDFLEKQLITTVELVRRQLTKL
jgi:dynein heavy chain